MIIVYTKIRIGFLMEISVLGCPEKSGFYTMPVAFTRAQTTELILTKLTENMYSILDCWYVNLYMGASNCFENFFKIHPSIQ